MCTLCLYQTSYIIMFILHGSSIKQRASTALGGPELAPPVRTKGTTRAPRATASLASGATRLEVFAGRGPVLTIYQKHFQSSRGTPDRAPWLSQLCPLRAEASSKHQKCTSKGIWRQGIGSKRRNSLQKSLCPVVICPCLIM